MDYDAVRDLSHELLGARYRLEVAAAIAYLDGKPISARLISDDARLDYNRVQEQPAFGLSAGADRAHHQDGGQVSAFPTDDITLAMLEMACQADDDGSSHLMEFLTFGSEELAPYEYFDTEQNEVVRLGVYAGGYHPNDVILALIAEVRRLRDGTNNAQTGIAARRDKDAGDER